MQEKQVKPSHFTINRQLPPFIPTKEFRMEPQQKPTVGRIVHYQAHGSPNGQHKSLPRAAIITAVHEDGSTDVCVLNPTGMYFDRGTPFSGEPKAGHWNWPPRF